MNALILAIAMTLAPVSPAQHHRRDDGGYEESGQCNREGNCNDQHRYAGRDDNHRSFSPDKVIICVQPGSCQFGNQPSDGSSQR